MPLTPQLEEMLRAAGDPSTPTKKLTKIYQATSIDFQMSNLAALIFNTAKFLKPHEIPKMPPLEYKERLLFLDALAANPSSPDEVLLGLKDNTMIVTNPRFLQIVAKETAFSEPLTLLQLLQTTPNIPKNVQHLFTESSHAGVRGNATLHVSMAGEAGSNWRDEVGPMLARGCDTSLVDDFAKENNIIPDWVYIHLAQSPIVQEEEAAKTSRERLRLLCHALRTGGGWTILFPWFWHLGCVLYPQSTISHWNAYANFGNRFIRAAARERLENFENNN
jgi:hypothetical protein